MGEIREGDIEALRNKASLEGRPIKSTIIRDEDVQIFYTVDDEGKVEIKEVLKP